MKLKLETEVRMIRSKLVAMNSGCVMDLDWEGKAYAAKLITAAMAEQPVMTRRAAFWLRCNNCQLCRPVCASNPIFDSIIIGGFERFEDGEVDSNFIPILHPFVHRSSSSMLKSVCSHIDSVRERNQEPSVI